MSRSNGPSLFSSISSFFGGASGPSSGPNGLGNPHARRNKSVFGDGFPSSSRRGFQGRVESDAWALPYSQYGAESSGTMSPGGQQYPPTPGYAPYSTANGADGRSSSRGRPTDTAASSVADFTNLHPAASHSNLVSSSGGTAGASGPYDSSSRTTGVNMPSTAYPPLQHTWNRVRLWCEGNYEELVDTLNWPATEAQIDELEMTIGFALPSAVRDSYLCFDGQELESAQSCSDGLFFGLPLLSLEQIAEEWKFWRAVDDDPSTAGNPDVQACMTSCPDKWVRSEYSHRAWIPLITDHVGNYIGVDLSPDPSGQGASGQVIIFGRDFDTKIVVWRGEGEGGWGRFLQSFVEELEAGEMWTLDDLSGGSSGDEDGLGYESYFSGGGGGASKGGGDRGGDGAASFKLIGEYKGWPVLDAWADRSVRFWEDAGLPSGRPPWQSEIPTPSLRFEGVNEHGEALDAEGSDGPRRNGSGEGDWNSAQEHPLVEHESNTEANGNSSLVAPVANDDRDLASSPALAQRRISDTLSPPLPPSRSQRKAQKAREETGSDNLTSTTRRAAPPPMASPLDLPTIDDVRTSYAAALAEHSRSAQFELDFSGPTTALGRGGEGGSGWESPQGAGSEFAAARGAGAGYSDTAHYAVRQKPAHRGGPRALHVGAGSSAVNGQRDSSAGSDPLGVSIELDRRDTGSLDADDADTSRTKMLQGSMAPESTTSLIDASSAPASPLGGSGRSLLPNTFGGAPPNTSSPLSRNAVLADDLVGDAVGGVEAVASG